jgi:hypothetical protein
MVVRINEIESSQMSGSTIMLNAIPVRAIVTHHLFVLILSTVLLKSLLPLPM